LHNGNINNIEIENEHGSNNTVVRKAIPDDIDDIMSVACSVGNDVKNHKAGFLMDDYIKDYDYFKEKFLLLIRELKRFYVVEEDTILGFLISYSSDEWLHHNPSWLQDVIWAPQFDIKNTCKFVLIDKTAIKSGVTGMGLGSLLYKKLFEDIKEHNISNIFAETIISPKPNFASLEFRMKQRYDLAGVRFESYKGTVYTDLVYHKSV